MNSKIKISRGFGMIFSVFRERTILHPYALQLDKGESYIYNNFKKNSQYPSYILEIKVLVKNYPTTISLNGSLNITIFYFRFFASQI
jgi:hypothetical protein